MFEKNMRLSFLLDFYGDALDDRTRSIIKAYYDDDLSLAEIADGEGISRQGVRHIIKKGEDSLDFFEKKLGLAAHYQELESAIQKLEAVKANIAAGQNPEQSQSLLTEVIKTIQNKGL